MKGLVFGLNQVDFENQLNGESASNLLERGLLAGTTNQVVDQLGQLEEAGVQKVMLQWNDLDDLPRLEAFSQGVLPQLKTVYQHL
jgi:alkanesulfonate monooxygenase SsuD/methylene tetrahydromethanopterin reductase-like flavin-dependent oxidoreductase (luciferase family)